MGKKKYTTEYFNIKPALEKYTDAKYFLAWGQREDGKSYTGKSVLKDFINYEYGEKFIYLRRLHIHITRKNMVKLFDDIPDLKKRFNSEVLYDSQKGFYLESTGQVIGYAMSIQDAYLLKSIPTSNVKYILFDEFIDYTYLPDEIALFLHTIKTICRPPNDVRAIMMFGNTVNKFCPYFDLFKINPSKMNMGEWYYFQHSLGVKGVAMHTPIKVKNIETKEKYDNFVGFDDNESVNMIMFGEWEYNKVNTKQIDGIGWNCKRHLLPMYITALKNVYEVSLHNTSKLPIVFVRKINTQNGKVRKEILYNYSYDNSVILYNNNSFVPIINTVNELLDERTLNMWKTIQLCYEANRIIFDTAETGSNFMYIMSDKK